MHRFLGNSAVTFFVLATACTHYVEVPRSAIGPGTTVRITLARDAVEGIAEREDLPGLRPRLDGQVQATETADAIAVLVRRRDASPADRSGLSAWLEVPWSSIQRVEEKQFSPRRTAGTAAAAAVVTALILSQTNGGTSNGEGDPPINNRIRLPLLRLIFR